MNDALKKAQIFIDQVRQSGVPVSNATVFGSHSKGVATKDSDIDVCVVSPTFGRDYFEEMVRLRKIALKVDSRLEPLPFNPSDLADPYSTLASEVRKYGISLE